MRHARRGRAVCAMVWFTVGATADAAGTPNASKLPFVLEHHLHARRTVRGGTVTLDDVVTRQSVLVNGDRLQLSIRTSQRGYLYLAFCSQRDTGRRYHGLSVFPSQGSIALTASVTQTIPSREDEIVLDDDPGQEILFIVVSKTELSRSDSHLADILDGARQGVESADCGSFRRAVTGPGAKPTPTASQAARAGAQPSSPAPATVPSALRPPPVATIERGVDIVLNRALLGADDAARLDAGGGAAGRATNEAMQGVDAGPDGIVVLRYEFVHVAPGHPAPSK